VDIQNHLDLVLPARLVAWAAMNLGCLLRADRSAMTIAHGLQNHKILI